MPRSWLLQANPDTWRVYDWWEETDEELEHWTLAQRSRADIGPCDNFAFWVGGRDAGVYAVGKVTCAIEREPIKDDGYWNTVPEGEVPGVYLQTTRYLFDRPIYKAELLTDPDFAQSLVIRMPRTGNPIPLQPAEWHAIQRLVGRSRATSRADTSHPVVTHRRLGRVPEDIDVAGPSGGTFRSFPEARLVKAYERWRGVDLSCTSVMLPSGERLVCDIYDEAEGLLIEAKAAATRSNVRPAVGQLLDYRRVSNPRPGRAVLLPEAPTDDVLALLHSASIAAIVQDGANFRVL